MLISVAIGIKIAQVLLALLTAPLLLGLNNAARARLQGRRGSGVLQPYHNLRKLLARPALHSPTTSWVAALTPLVLLVSTLLALLLLPLLVVPSGLGFIGDSFALVYVLALGSFCLALAGLDSGSSAGGMGASRRTLITTLSLPTLLLSLLALAPAASTTSLEALAAFVLAQPLIVLEPAYVLALLAFGLVLLAETGRLPLDRPSVSSALAFGPEGVLLEFSGRDLALLELAGALRLFLFLGLLSSLFLPWGIATQANALDLALATLALLAKLLLLSVLLAGLETLLTTLRLARVTGLLGGALALALLAVALGFLL